MLLLWKTIRLLHSYLWIYTHSLHLTGHLVHLLNKQILAVNRNIRKQTTYGYSQRDPANRWNWFSRIIKYRFVLVQIWFHISLEKTVNQIRWQHSWLPVQPWTAAGNHIVDQMTSCYAALAEPACKDPLELHTSVVAGHSNTMKGLIL